MNYGFDLPRLSCTFCCSCDPILLGDPSPIFSVSSSSFFDGCRTRAFSFSSRRHRAASALAVDVHVNVLSSNLHRPLPATPLADPSSPSSAAPREVAVVRSHPHWPSMLLLLCCYATHQAAGMFFRRRGPEITPPIMPPPSTAELWPRSWSEPRHR